MTYFAIVHDPQDNLDYKIDWAAWLGSDTITAATVTPPSGIAVADVSITDTNTSVTFWLSGGTLGNDYTLTCHIETAGGRETDRSIVVQCRNK